MSEPEYIAREREAEHKSELVDGDLVAMSGASYAHNVVATNLLAQLHRRLSGGPCRALGSDQRVAIAASHSHFYPDISVVCGGPRFHPEDDRALVNPRVLVEVLSPSTEDYDRGKKFRHYRRCPTLEAYVLVSQDEQHVEVFRREGDLWILTEHGADDTLELASLGVAVPLTEIYEGLDVPRELDLSVPPEG